jgi:hypothetical protein
MSLREYSRSRAIGRKSGFTMLLKKKAVFVISCLLFFSILLGCGKRENPVALEPYQEVGVVNDLSVSMRDGQVYLKWSIPSEKEFPRKALKGFVVFRAEVPQGQSVEECDCRFRSLDFIVSDNRERFEYLDKKALKGRSYVYKITVMDIKNRMGRDSNTVYIKGEKEEIKEQITIPPAPEGLIAVYTHKSIVLIWNEIKDQKINSYRVYRSKGKEFLNIGETTTPTFTDRNVEKSVKYFYRVTAVGEAEGPPSEIVEIVTEPYR